MPARVISSTSTWSPVSIEALAPLDGVGTLEPIMLTISAGGRSWIFPAMPGGEKFALLLEGEVTLTLEGGACPQARRRDHVSLSHPP